MFPMTEGRPVLNFVRAEFLYFRNPVAAPSAYGPITWSAVNGSWRGRVTVAAHGLDDLPIELEFVVRPGRPAEPTLIVLLRGVWAMRVDVNGTHKDSRFSHVQWRMTSSDPTATKPVADGFPALELGDNVAEDTYRLMFIATAKEVGVDVSAVEWTDPPEGRPA